MTQPHSPMTAPVYNVLRSYMPQTLLHELVSAIQTFQHDELDELITTVRAWNALWRRPPCHKARSVEELFALSEALPHVRFAPTPGLADQLTKVSDEIRVKALKQLTTLVISATNTSEPLTKLLTSSALPNVYEVLAEDNVSTMHTLELLRHAPWGPQITSLELDLFDSDDVSACVTLFQDDPFPLLTSLKLKCNTFSPSMPALLATPVSARLESLDMSEFGPELLPMLDAPQLTRLTLRKAFLGSKGVKALGKANLPALEELAFDDTQLGAAGAKAIWASKLTGQLKRLSILDTKNWSAKVFESLEKSKNLDQMLDLNIEVSVFKAAKMEPISDTLFMSPGFAGLRSLHLNVAGLGGTALETIARSPQLSRLRQLSLRITPEAMAQGFPALLDAPFFRSLEVLALSCPDDEKPAIMSSLFDTLDVSGDSTSLKALGLPLQRCSVHMASSNLFAHTFCLRAMQWVHALCPMYNRVEEVIQTQDDASEAQSVATADAAWMTSFGALRSLTQHYTPHKAPALWTWCTTHAQRYPEQYAQQVLPYLTSWSKTLSEPVTFFIESPEELKRFESMTPFAMAHFCMPRVKTTLFKSKHARFLRRIDLLFSGHVKRPEKWLEAIGQSKHLTNLEELHCFSHQGYEPLHHVFIADPSRATHIEFHSGSPGDLRDPIESGAASQIKTLRFPLSLSFAEDLELLDTHYEGLRALFLDDPVLQPQCVLGLLQTTLPDRLEALGVDARLDISSLWTHDWPHLHTLELRHATEASLASLAAHPIAAQLRTLRLLDTRYELPRFHPVFHGGSFLNLEELIIEGDDDDLRKPAQRFEMGTELLESISAHIALPSLKRLALRRFPVTHQIGAQLARIKPFEQLEALDLSLNQMRAPWLEQIVSAPYLHNLERLHLCHLMPTRSNLDALNDMSNTLTPTIRQVLQDASSLKACTLVVQSHGLPL